MTASDESQELRAGLDRVIELLGAITRENSARASRHDGHTAHISTCSADKVIRDVDCSGTKGLATMDDDVEQPEVGELSRVFETTITMYGDPGEIQHAVELLGFNQISSFSCRSLATREARLVFRVTDTTPLEAKRVIQGFTLAIEHVLEASRAPTTVDLTDPSTNERPCPCGGRHLSACHDYHDEPA